MGCSEGVVGYVDDTVQEQGCRLEVEEREALSSLHGMGFEKLLVLGLGGGVDVCGSGIVKSATRMRHFQFLQVIVNMWTHKQSQ